MEDLIILDGNLQISYADTINISPNLPIIKIAPNYIIDISVPLIYNFNVLKFDNIYNLTMFVEGVSSDIDTNIYISEVNKNETLYNGFYCYNNKINIQYKPSTYKLTYKNWYKFLNKYETMIPGSISGSISRPLSCGNLDLYIRCFRSSDNHYIGEYKVDGNTYEIPNLNCTEFYNIVMVDKNRIIEQQVSSHRQPIPYDRTVYVPYKITNIKIVELEDNSILISWLLDTNTKNGKIGNIKIYYANKTIDKTKLNEYPYFTPNSIMHYKTFLLASNFIIEHSLGDVINYYDVFYNNYMPRNIEYIIEDKDFVSAPRFIEYKLEHKED